MAFGAQIFSDNGKQWVDVVQPTWVLDMIVDAHGTGSTVTYALDTTRFQIKAFALNYTVTFKQNPPSFSYQIIDSGHAKVNYSLPTACTFIVAMETK